MKWYSIIIFIVMACNPNKKIIEDSVAKNNINSIAFKQLVQSSIGGYEYPQIKVIKEQKALEETFGFINRFRKPGFPIPNKIDFSKETIVAVFMGQKNTGGFSVTVDKIVDNEDKVNVFIKEEAPHKNDMVTMAITQPFCIVTIQSTKELVFEKVN